MSKINDILILGHDEYLTTKPTIYEWKKGEAEFRLVLPHGQNTDFASAPWWARALGFKKEDTRWQRASLFHDFLYYHKGDIPDGIYQYKDPETGEWLNISTPRWTRKQADQLFLKIMLEDGFPKWKAHTAYRAVRLCGGMHSGNLFW